MVKNPKSKNYEQMANELAKLVEWFESSQVNLDESVVKYQQAMELLEQMENYLKTAQNKVKKIAVKLEE
ncbi:MAG TPA: exodeoxyribonuclease VII small subunit [Candidatus Babeliales bacterium]|nr:exodeoxyribonuclease VII small subunit [Candidatus Babeliales bacterium]